MNNNYLEHEQRKLVRVVCRAMDTAGLAGFSAAFIASKWNELNTGVRHLDRLPELEFRELIGVIHRLREARDELRLARFLFDLEEVNSVHRLVMRNRAVRRSHDILQDVLGIWPSGRASIG